MDVNKLLTELNQQHLIDQVKDPKIKEHLLFLKQLYLKKTNLDKAKNFIEKVKTSEVLTLDQRSEDRTKKIEELGIQAYK